MNYDFSKIEKLLDSFPQIGLPAVDFSVAKDGKEVYRHMAGYSDLQGTKPVSENDLYWVYSCSKVITCSLMMTLVESGKISITDPVSKYLPAFENLYVLDRKTGTLTKAQNVLTIEHCFSMSGGFDYNLKTANLQRAITAEGATTRSIISALANEPLWFEPGTHYRYSLCHDILVAVAESATGENFEKYARRVMFEPLGMKDTSYLSKPEDRKRLSQQYTTDGFTGKCKEFPMKNEYLFTENYISGGAGITTSVNDFMKLLTTLSLGGTSPDGYRFLKPETVKRMGENHLCEEGLKEIASGRLFGYGFGLCGRCHINPAYSLSKSPVGEFGWDGAAGAFCMVDAVNHIALYLASTVRSNTYIYNWLHPTLRNMVYEALKLD